MSNVNKVKMADILIKAGSNIRKVFVLCKIPLPLKVEIIATAVHEHRARIIDDNKAQEIKKNIVFKKGSEPLPLRSFVESMPVNDGSSDWSMRKSLLIVTYDKSVKKIYFGEESSGDLTDSKIPIVNRVSLPMDNGWPDLKTINQKYPLPANQQ